MTDTNRETERDAILFEMHKTYSNPTATDIEELIKRHPHFADDIRSHAAIIKDWAARQDLPAPEPDKAMVSRSQSRMLDALHKARSAATGSQAPARTFEQIMAATGTNIPDLARSLDIGRSVLSALVSGRMLAPVGERLVAALTNCWSITVEQLEAAATLALTTPTLGLLKAGGTPSVIPRSYEELVRASSMSDARKQYWLGKA